MRSSLLAALAATTVLTACASAGDIQTRADRSYVARDVGTIYSLAKRRLDAGRYEESAILFDEVERQHPYSEWARRAQLMSAYSYYAAAKYPEAIASAQRFLSIHPGNKDAPYALYLIAMSHYERIEDVTRDQQITMNALNALGEVVRRYPDTRYAADARLKMDLVNDHLAGKEMEIGRFYQRSANWLASVMRFRNVVDNYQTTTHAPEALMRLTESYLALGVPAEAQKAAAVLGANYPESKWYKRAFELVQRNRDKLAPAAPAQTAAATTGG